MLNALTKITDLINENNYDALTTEDVDALCGEFRSIATINPPTLLLFKADGVVRQRPKKINVVLIKQYTAAVIAVFQYGDETLKLHFIKQHCSILMQIMEFDSNASAAFKATNSVEVLAIIESAQQYLEGLQLESLENEEKKDISTAIRKVFEELLMHSVLLLQKASKDVLGQALLQFAKVVRDLSKLGNVAGFEQITRKLFTTLVTLADASQTDINGDTVMHILATVQSDNGIYNLLSQHKAIDVNMPNRAGRTVLHCYNAANFKTYYTAHHAKITQDLLLQLLDDAIKYSDLDKVAFILNIMPLGGLSLSKLEDILFLLLAVNVNIYQDAIEEILKEMASRPDWKNYKLDINGVSLWEKMGVAHLIMLLQNSDIVPSAIIAVWLDVQIMMRIRDNFNDHNIESFDVGTAAIAKFLSLGVAKECRKSKPDVDARLGYALSFIAQYGDFSCDKEPPFFSYAAAENEAASFRFRILHWCCHTLAGAKASAIDIAANTFNGAMLVAVLKYKYDLNVTVATDFVAKINAALSILLYTRAPDENAKRRKAKAINQVLEYLYPFWFGDEAVIYKEFKQKLEGILRADPELAALVRTRAFGITVLPRPAEDVAQVYSNRALLGAS